MSPDKTKIKVLFQDNNAQIRDTVGGLLQRTVFFTPLFLHKLQVNITFQCDTGHALKDSLF